MIRNLIIVLTLALLLTGCTSQKEYDIVVDQNTQLKEKYYETKSSSMLEYYNLYTIILEKSYSYYNSIATMQKLSDVDIDDIEIAYSIALKTMDNKYQESLDSCNDSEWNDYSEQFAKDGIKEAYDRFEERIDKIGITMN